MNEGMYDIECAIENGSIEYPYVQLAMNAEKDGTFYKVGGQIHGKQ